MRPSELALKHGDVAALRRELRLDALHLVHHDVAQRAERLGQRGHLRAEFAELGVLSTREVVGVSLAPRRARRALRAGLAKLRHLLAKRHHVVAKRGELGELREGLLRSQ